MFSKMKNIDSAFRHIRLFSLSFLLGCVVISCFMIYHTNKEVRRLRGKVYVLVNGKLVEALMMDRNIPVELRDHLYTFHRLFFTLSSDEKAIQQNISKALYLADESALIQYENLKEAGYYNNIISANITQTFQLDSISLDMNKAPYYFKCYGKLMLKRTTSTVMRNLITDGFLRTGLLQSDNNNHGFLIERWNIIDNRDINQQN
jgi:conjugative transposon TraK protein